MGIGDRVEYGGGRAGQDVVDLRGANGVLSADLYRFTNENARTGDVGRSHACSRRCEEIVCDPIEIVKVVGRRACNVFAWRHEDSFATTAKLADQPVGIMAGYGDNVRTRSGIAQARRWLFFKVVSSGDGDEKSCLSQGQELVFEYRPLWDVIALPLGTQRQVDRSDRMFERVDVRFHPLKRLFNPLEVALSLVVE